MATDEEHRLVVAAGRGDVEAVRRLLRAGVSVHARDREDFSALFTAAQMGRTAVVALLLEEGANVNEWDDDGFTVLFIAARQGHLAVVALMLEEGANVNVKSNNGFSALTMAEIELELETQQANFERDVNRLKKQYEKRGRALRAERASRLSNSGGASTAS